MTPREFSKERSRLVSALKRTLRPHLRASQYREDGTSRPLQIWAARNKDGDYSLRKYALKGGFVVQQFQGFTSRGVVLDIKAGGLTTLDFEQIPIEDLYSLNRWAEQKFGELEEQTIREAQSRSMSAQDRVDFAKYEGLFAATNRVPVDRENVQLR